MSRLPWIFLTIALLLCPSCGITAKKMDPAAAQHIHTIALLDVAVTKDRVYLDPAAMTTSALILGDVGALGVAIATATPQQALKKALPDPASPSRLLSDEIAAALQRKGFVVRRIADGPPSHRPDVPPAVNNDLFVKDYTKVVAGDADAVLDPVCVTFGYERFPFTQADHPMLTLAVRLVSPDSKTIHYAQAFCFTQKENHLNGCVNLDTDRAQFTAPWSDVFKDQKLLDNQLRIAARSLGDAIAHDIAAEK